MLYSVVRNEIVPSRTEDAIPCSRGLIRLGVTLGVTLSIYMWIIASAVPVNAAVVNTDRVSGTALLVVSVLTILAFGAAVIAGRRTLRAPASSGSPIREDLIDIDLLESRSSSVGEPRIVKVFESILLVVLALYAALDHGFAWLHLPGTPLFVGELTLAVGVVALMSTQVSVVTMIRRSPPLKVLTAWMAWGFIFLLAQVTTFGVDAVRDSALWYYGIVAMFVAFLLISDPSRFGRWVDLFGKVVPFLLGWFLIAIVLDTLFGLGAPYVPDSRIPFFGHRLGNVAVLGGITIGFIWLVDRERGRFTTFQRIGYTTLAAIVIIVAGFQNRGGLVAATVGVLVMMVLLRRRRAELVLVLAGVAIFLATFAIVSDIKIPISSGREISAEQMIDNIDSILNPESGGERQTETTEWRLDLWSRVLEDVTSERPLTGFGPGPNLGLRYGVTTNEEVPLRNPHNSHVGILARMGWVGVGLWAMLWIVWVFELAHLRSRLRFSGRSMEAGLIAWLLVSALMILVNAIFDPTLEGPQVSFWLWFMFGVGAAILLVYSGEARWAFDEATPPLVSTKGAKGEMAPDGSELS